MEMDHSRLMIAANSLTKLKSFHKLKSGPDSLLLPTNSNTSILPAN